MKDYKLKLNLCYSITAESEEEAKIKLEERFAQENMTAENEFWDNMEVYEDKIDECIKWIEEQEDLEIIPTYKDDYYEIETPNTILKFSSDRELIIWVEEKQNKIREEI
jgi:hypothetical protein